MNDDQVFELMMNESPWKSTGSALGAFIGVSVFLLLVCSPAIVWAVYTAVF